jgi:stage II sporulation protein M
MRVAEIIRQEVLVRNLVVATAIFFVSLALGIPFGRNIAEDLIGELGGILGSFAPTGGVSTALLFIIFINNAVKTLGLIFLGILLGVPAILFIGLNGFIIGGFASALAAANGWTYVVASFLPHGVIEIPVVLLTVAFGLTLGMESFKWLRHRENRVKPLMSDCLKVYTRLILPGLAIAAVIETFITPLVIGLVGTG